MRERSAAVVDSGLIFTLTRVDEGTLFVRYQLSTDFTVAKWIERDKSIREAVGHLIPELLLGILIGRLDG